MARAQLPQPHVPMIDAAGRVTVEWYDFFRTMDGMKLAQLRDVDVSGVADGEQLTYVAANDKWEPGAP